MRSARLIPVAVLALAVACTENASTPVENNRPQFAATGSPHFIGSATSCTVQGFNLVCSFKETGLSSGSVETVTLSVGTVTAGYACVNGGGNVPSDPKKTFSGPVSTTATFPASRNGNINGTLTLSPPAASTQLSCPSGQTATLLSASYSSPAALFDQTSGATISVSFI